MDYLRNKFTWSGHTLSYNDVTCFVFLFTCYPTKFPCNHLLIFLTSVLAITMWKCWFGQSALILSELSRRLLSCIVFRKPHFLWNKTLKWRFPSMSLKTEPVHCSDSPDRTHTRAHSSLRRESSVAATVNGSFKTSLELVTKERIQNWVGCTVTVHKDLEIWL